LIEWISYSYRIAVNDHYLQKFLARVEMASERELFQKFLRFENKHNTRYRYSKLSGKDTCINDAEYEQGVTIATSSESAGLSAFKVRNRNIWCNTVYAQQ